MEFDKSKVLGPLSDNNSDYEGWFGYFADTLSLLETIVEDDYKSGVGKQGIYDQLLRACDKTDNDMNFICDRTKIGYVYFYPVEKPEPKWRPYKNLTEMVADLMDFHPKGEGFSAGALARILIGTHFFLGDYIYTPTTIDTISDSLYMDGWVSMDDLLNAGWMFIDPETDSFKRCGIRETNQEE